MVEAGLPAYLWRAVAALVDIRERAVMAEMVVRLLRLDRAAVVAVGLPYQIPKRVVAA
jgi:hypothetical protein